MVIGINDPVQARDLPKFLIAGYRLIPYFIFNAIEGINLNFELLIHLLFHYLS